MTKEEYINTFLLKNKGYNNYGNFIVHSGISEEAILNFCPPIGKSFVIFETFEDTNINLRAAFTLMNKENDIHCMGEFDISLLNEEDPVYKVDIKPICPGIETPPGINTFVKSMHYREDGKYEMPKARTYWDC